MATTALYTKFPAKALNGEIDFDTDTIKVALVTSSYTPDQDAHDYWDDVSANEASGTGYTSGGATLGSKTVTQDNATNKQTFDAADVSWTSSTVTARYAVIYKSTGTASTSPLIAYVDFGSNQSSSSGTFQITWNASGIFYTTVA